MKKTTTLIAACLLALGILSYFSHQDMLLQGDGRRRYDALATLMEFRLMSTTFSMVMPFFAIPFYALGRLVGHPAEAVSFFSLTVTLLFLPLFWRSMRNLSDPETATLCVLMLLGNSMLLASTPYFEPEPFSVVLMGLGILWYHEGRLVPAALALLVSAANIPASLLGAAFVGLRWAWLRGRVRWLCLPLLAGLECALERIVFRHGAAVLALQPAAHPSILPFSKSADFSYPMVLGVLNIVFSFGKGILFFAPGLLLWWSVQPRLRVQERRLLGDMLAYLLGLIIVYSNWTGWADDNSWGPRFFLFASLPASILLAISLREKTASIPRLGLTLVVLAASAWVAIDGLVYNFDVLQSFFKDEHAPLFFATYNTAEFSPLFLPFWQGMTSIDSAARIVVFWSFMAASLSLAYPLIKQLVERALEIDFPEVTWRF
jgi:hypothetical protein